MLELTCWLPFLFVTVFTVIYKVILLSISMMIAEVTFKMMIFLPITAILWIFVKMMTRKEDKHVTIRIKVMGEREFDQVFVDRDAASEWVKSLQRGTFDWYKELKSDNTLIHFSTA